MNRLKIALQYAMPKKIFTEFAGKFAESENFLTQTAIKAFIRKYKINMQEARHENPAEYKTFNDFFTRLLKPDARVLAGDENTITQPADAEVSQFGAIDGDSLIQAKGHDYSLLALLGGDKELTKTFEDGQFATLYLSPSDYHRVHMPMDGVLRQTTYIPGELFSVNILTSQHVPDLFARNERLVCLFDTAIGPMVQILVGATIVGSIDTVWAGTVTPPRGAFIRKTFYPAEGEGMVSLKKGEEMGLFKLGSTVINLFPQDTVSFTENMKNGAKMHFGEEFAQISCEQ